MTLAANALTTYATVKDALGLPDDTAQSRVELLINAASAVIEQELNRPLCFQAGEVEEIRAKGVNTLRLRRTPVKSIAQIALLAFDRSVLYTYDPVTYSCTDADAEAGIVSRTVSGLLAAPISGSSGWMWSAELAMDIAGSPLAGSERKSLRVIYDGGWITPAQADTAHGGMGGTRDLPYDIEHACIIAVSSAFARYGTNQNITSATLHQSSVSYDSGSTSALPADAMAMLRPYRRYA